MISLNHLILLGFLLFSHLSPQGENLHDEQDKQSTEVQKPQASPESLQFDAGSMEKQEVLEAVYLDTAIYLFEKLDSQLQI